MSIEILTISAMEYATSRGKELSNYDLLGVRGEGEDIKTKQKKKL